MLALVGDVRGRAGVVDRGGGVGCAVVGVLRGLAGWIGTWSQSLLVRVRRLLVLGMVGRQCWWVQSIGCQSAANQPGRCRQPSMWDYRMP
jgi:hypothetical protein